MNKKRVAIVHDWFVGGGAEQVVYQIHKMYPDAPIYTSYCNDYWKNKLSGTTVTTSYMQHWPFSKLRKFLPILRQRWFSKLDLSDYELVISSSGAEAKGLNTPENITHVNYCHAPTHYYWSRYDEYLKNPGFGVFNWLAKFGLKILIKPMRNWDYKAAQKPDYLIANSTYIQKQIKKYYNRNSVVIHPPVDVDFFRPKAPNLSVASNNFIVVGRQTPYKRIDLAVKACSSLNLPLTVVGDGPEHNKITKVAGNSIVFVKNAKKSDLPGLFANSSAFIFPGLDDFGIAPVEAMASGLPVIAFRAGGALDYVVERKTGLFFEKQTVKSLIDVLKPFKSSNFEQKFIIQKAQEFSSKKFEEKLSSFLDKINQNVLGV